MEQNNNQGRIKHNNHISNKPDFFWYRFAQTYIVWFSINAISVLAYFLIEYNLKSSFSKVYPIIVLFLLLVINFFLMQHHRRNIWGDNKYFKVNGIIFGSLFCLCLICSYLVPEPFFTYLFCAVKAFSLLDLTPKIVSIIITFLLFAVEMCLARIGQGHRARNLKRKKKNRKDQEKTLRKFKREIKTTW